MFFKKPIEKEFEFNKIKLFEEMGKIVENLYSYKEDPGIIKMMKVIELWKNKSVLDVASARNDQERIELQAKLNFCVEIEHYFSTHLNKKPKEEKKTKRPIGTFTQFRRVSDQAESAI